MRILLSSVTVEMMLGHIIMGKTLREREICSSTNDYQSFILLRVIH